VDDLPVKKKILKAAEEVLTVLETQAAGFTKLVSGAKGARWHLNN
jgi:hypothetical protein